MVLSRKIVVSRITDMKVNVVIASLAVVNVADSDIGSTDSH